MTKLSKQKLINTLTVSGITDEGIEHICKEIDVPVETFYEFIENQTTLYIPKGIIYYQADVDKFLRIVKPTVLGFAKARD